MKKNSQIFVAGQNTIEGKSLIRMMVKKGYRNIINLKEHEPDLTDYKKVELYFKTFHPEYVFHLAGKQGGIKANEEMPSTLMIDNLKINSNIIEIAYLTNVEKLIFLGRSCVYPKFAKQPMKPEMLMSGLLEPTNSAYATSKLAGIELCKAYQSEHNKNFISVIPANVFGPEDDFSLNDSHVIPAIMMKIDKAKLGNESSVEIWGTGKPEREFIYVDDLADACLFIMNNYNENETINIGSGFVVSILELSEIIKSIIGYKGNIVFNSNNPDGMPIKTLDSKKFLKMGWKPSNTFNSAIKKTYNWYKQNY